MESGSSLGPSIPRSFDPFIFVQTSTLRSTHQRGAMRRMGDFAADTRVDGADGVYTATLSRDWEIWGPNGGYLAAIALRAAGAATPLRRPATLACQFLSVAEFGAVELTVDVLRGSKRAAALRVSMSQQDRLILAALVWVIDAASEGLEHDVTRMPTGTAGHGAQTLRRAATRGVPMVSVLAEPRNT
jgi:hypothetical protein